MGRVSLSLLEGIMLRASVATLLVTVAALSCAPSATQVSPGTLKGPMFDKARESADLSKAVSLLEEGECNRAVGFLSVYTGQEAGPAAVDFLLGHAHLCLGDYLKAAHHTRKAWEQAETGRDDVTNLALAVLESLSKEGRTRMTAENATAAWQLTRLDIPLKPDPVLVQLVRLHSERLASRGELQGAAQGVEAMKKLGAGLGDTLVIETKVLARLGKVEELKARVEEGRSQLGDKSGKLLYEAAVAAEAAFRSDLASWLYLEARKAGCDEGSLELDIARTYLQLGQFPEALTSLKAYIAPAAEAQAYQSRLKSSVDLLVRFSRFVDAATLLSAASAKFPSDFGIVVMLTDVGAKAPEAGNPQEQWRKYLEAAGYTEESVMKVGDHLVDSRQCSLVTSLFSAAADQKRFPSWSAFYLGACELAAKQEAKAQTLFKSAVEKATVPAAVYRRIAAEYRKVGRLDVGISWLERALKEKGDQVEVLLLLADLKEQQSAGSGVALVEQSVQKVKLAGDSALQVARWFFTHDRVEAAVPLAKQAAEQLDVSRQWEAWGVLADAYLKLNKIADTCAALTKMLEIAPERTLAVGAVLVVTEGMTLPQVACVRAGAVESMGSPEALSLDWLAAGAISGMYCGRPSPDLLKAYLLALGKGLTMGPLLAAALDRDSSAALVKVVDENSTSLDLGTEAWGRLALLAAKNGALTYTRGFVTRFLASPPIQADVMLALAQSLGLYGAREDAARILGAAFKSAEGAEREEVGVAYAAALLTLGQEEEGMRIVRETVDTTAHHAAAAVKLTMLLLEADRPALARQVAVSALKNPGMAAALLGSLRDKVMPENPTPGSKEEALAKLLSDLSGDLAPETDPCERLLYLAVYAGWLEKADPAAVVAELEPLAKTPALRNVLATALLRFGWASAALPLLQKALEQTPSDMPLLQSTLAAMLLDCQLRGRPVESIQDDIRELTKRTLLARENSTDGQQTLAFWLADYGLGSLAAEMLTNLKAAGRLSPRTLVRYGSVLLALGRASEALANLEDAVQSSSCDADILADVVRQLGRGDQRTDCLRLLTDCANKYPRSTQRWWLLATTLMDEKLTEEQKKLVLEAVDKVVKAKPEKSAEAIERMSAAGMTAEALELARFAVEKGATSSMVDSLGAIFGSLSRQGRSDEMERLASMAAKRAGTNTDTLTEIASLLFDYELWEAGLGVMRLAAKPENPATLGLLGLREVGVGEKKAGIEHIFTWLDSEFEKAKEGEDGRVPEGVSKLLFLLHEFLLDSGEKELAKDLMSRAVKRYPQDPKARIALLGHLVSGPEETFFDEWAKLALCPLPAQEELEGLQPLLSRMRREGRLARAVDSLERDWEARRSPSSLPYLVNALAAQRNRAVLLKVVDDALREEWADPYMLAQLGQLLVERDLAAEAEPLLLQALRVAALDTNLVPQIHRVLCRAYSAMGVRDRLQEVHKMVLLQNPENWELRDALVQNLAEYHFFPEAEKQLRFLVLSKEDPREPFEKLVRIASVGGRHDDAWRLILIASYGLAEAGYGVLYRFMQGADDGLQAGLASSLADRLASIQPHWNAIQILTAEEAFWAGKNQQALKTLDDVVKRSPTPANLADAMALLLRFQHFGKGMELAASHPEDAALQSKVAQALFVAGQPKEGMRFLQAALKADPKSGVDFLGNMMRYVYLLPPEARKLAVQSSCNGDKGPSVCLFFAGVQLLEEGKIPDAVKAFQRAGVGSNRRWAVALASVRALVRAQRLEEAWSLLQQERTGLRAKDVNTQLFSEMTDFVLVEKPSKEAAQVGIQLFLRSLEPSLAREPDDFWMRSQEAEAHMALNETAKVRELYERLLADAPWESGANNNLAYFLANQGVDLDLGVKLVKEAARLDSSSNVFYLDTLGWLLHKQGKHEEAEKFIAESLSLSMSSFGRNLSEVLWHLAEVQFALGKKKEGIEVLWQASYRDPEGLYGQKAREKLRELGLDPYRMK